MHATPNDFTNDGNGCGDATTVNHRSFAVAQELCVKGNQPPNPSNDSP
jgi:hypothetical protein